MRPRFAWIPVLAWALAAAVAAAAIGLSRPPAPLGADAADDVFSAARAFEHVERIAVRPHPVRTAANAEVRKYVVAQFEHLGFEVAVHTRSSAYGWPLKNILAKKPGHASTGVVLLVCHYDSAFGAPGAGDDASAIGAALETARIVAAGEPLRNDLWILVTDGEESGLLGAWAFAEHNPDLAKVDVVFNFEARGTSGRSLMFQTSPENSSLVAAYAAACSRPSASSLMGEFYRRLPNDTDFTVFLRHDVPGLNFAFIEDYVRYHTPEDTPRNLSLASVQHHGEAMLGLTRDFGERDLTALVHAEDAVYFDVIGRAFVKYPAGWAWGFTIGVVLLLILAAWAGQRRGAFTWRALGWSAVAVLRALTYAMVVVGAGAFVALEALGPDFPGPVKGGPHDGWLFLGMTLLALGTTNAVIGTATARHGSSAGIVAALGFFAGLLVATNVAMVGATFVFLWPLLLLLAAWCASMRVRGEGLATGIALLYALPVVVLLAPLGHLLFIGLALERSIFHAPLLGLWLAVLAPFFDRVGGGWLRPIVWGPILLGLVFFTVGLSA